MWRYQGNETNTSVGNVLILRKQKLFLYLVGLKARETSGNSNRDKIYLVTKANNSEVGQEDLL